jgi:hypothetical protein
VSNWVDLGQDIPGLRSSAIHALPSPAEPRVRAALEAHGFDMRVVEGRRITDDGSLFEGLHRELPLPDAFGHDWDSLDECLRDLFSRPGPPLAVLIRDADVLLRSDMQTFVTAIERFSTALYFAAEDDDDPRQCEVFLLGSGSGFGGG